MLMAKAAWSPMSSLLALARMVYRAKGQRGVSPDECNPFARRKKSVEKVKIGSLKHVFMACANKTNCK